MTWFGWVLLLSEMFSAGVLAVKAEHDSSSPGALLTSLLWIVFVIWGILAIGTGSL